MQPNNFTTDFFGIGILNGKTPENLGVLWRTAQNLGASFIFTVGKRYAHQASDTHNSVKSMPYYHYKDFNDFFDHLPKGVRIVGVEKTETAIQLEDFEHPRRCVYLLGAEDHGLTREAIDRSHFLIQFKSEFSLNVAVAGSIVLYDRSRNKPFQ
ncbi:MULTISPECIES: RNA methyltransferase [Croceibacter]|uniref:RNA methyltransferase n=1 Tax=Croceibacter TaxID=216431 RepID=UPI000C393355|nr:MULTISPECIES: RNA methyltransferase [Croceibacter]MBG26890.1 rRNA methyltransferase [Croceibacter sp.]HAT70751.1 rRNA methyltransferase [Flavobacteriaceae bacterium]|tara:strand:- start:148 stop:609 length:462 start_codon:yes stop_codon:yes gene_type:complete